MREPDGTVVTDRAREEIRIMQAARANPDHFAPIYECYFPRIYAYCLRRVSNPLEAEDLTSLIFTQALVGLRHYAGGSVAVWMFRIAHNALVNYYRSRRPLVSLEAIPFDIADASPGPGQQVVQAEQQRALRAVVESLPDDQRELLALKIAGELSSEEIGALLGKSAGAVRVELHRIIKRLRNQVRRKEL
jgi:RNA polymerase sigma factor (sigma-70 family)